MLHSYGFISYFVRFQSTRNFFCKLFIINRFITNPIKVNSDNTNDKCDKLLIQLYVSNLIRDLTCAKATSD